MLKNIVSAVAFGSAVAVVSGAGPDQTSAVTLPPQPAPTDPVHCNAPASELDEVERLIAPNCDYFVLNMDILVDMLLEIERDSDPDIEFLQGMKLSLNESESERLMKILRSLSSEEAKSAYNWLIESGFDDEVVCELLCNLILEVPAFRGLIPIDHHNGDALALSSAVEEAVRKDRFRHLIRLLSSQETLDASLPELIDDFLLIDSRINLTEAAAIYNRLVGSSLLPKDVDIQLVKLINSVSIFGKIIAAVHDHNYEGPVFEALLQKVGLSKNLDDAAQPALKSLARASINELLDESVPDKMLPERVKHFLESNICDAMTPIDVVALFERTAPKSSLDCFVRNDLFCQLVQEVAIFRELFPALDLTECGRRSFHRDVFEEICKTVSKNDAFFEKICKAAWIETKLKEVCVPSSSDMIKTLISGLDRPQHALLKQIVPEQLLDLISKLMGKFYAIEPGSDEDFAELNRDKVDGSSPGE